MTNYIVLAITPVQRLETGEEKIGMGLKGVCKIYNRKTETVLELPIGTDQEGKVTIDLAGTSQRIGSSSEYEITIEFPGSKMEKLVISPPNGTW